MCWSPAWSLNQIIIISVVAIDVVVAAVIVIDVGSGGNGVGSAFIVPWRLAIVRVPPW